MTTKAELKGLKTFAASMTVKDLQWQINNPAALGNDLAAMQVFKDELAKRTGFQKLGDVANRVVGKLEKCPLCGQSNGRHNLACTETNIH